MAYRVDDVQKVVKFYTDVLGFRVSDWHGDTFAFLRCGPDHHTVNFVFDEVPQLHHIAFEVKDWAEIQRACEWLAHERHPSGLGPRPPHHRPQCRDLSPQRRQGPGRVLLRDGPDEGRGARLFRPASLAPGSAATAESVAGRTRCATTGASARSGSSAAIRPSSEARQSFKPAFRSPPGSGNDPTDRHRPC